MEQQKVKTTEQNTLSADEALLRLKEGAARFREASHSQGDVSPALRRRTCDLGQNPYAVILTCSDSRVLPEAIFSVGIGELFVIRVAGNTVDKHQLGTVEYAIEHLGCKLVVVLGHTHCGAVDAALNHEPGGYIKFFVNEIKQAIGDETDEERACFLNAQHSAACIEQALLADEPDRAADVRVVTALYHLGSGRVEFEQGV